MPIPVWQRDVGEFIPFLNVKRGIPKQNLAVFCRKLAFLLDAGIPVKTALPIIAGQSPTALKKALTTVHTYVMRGDGFSEALTAATVFPDFLCGLAAVGEMTARLPRVMAQLADYYEQQTKTESEFKAAMIYPAAVTGLMLIVIGVAVTFVLPNYGRVFAASQVSLPALTQILLRFSSFTLTYPYILVASFTAVIIGVRFLLKSEWVDRCKLYFPLYRQTVNLRFAQAMALLLSSGQPLAVAVPACAQVLGNAKARRDMKAVAAGLTEGRPFWEMLAQIGYFDSLMTGMSRVGEETGRLPQAMDKCRVYFTQTHGQYLQRTSKLVEPIITVVLGILLGLVMLAVILPTFALMDIV
jgi:type IV pilus assembly protein PilC